VRPELERLAAELPQGRVTFHGRLAKAELADLVASCVASVVPSRWHENQPMTILESYAAQVPAVVTRLGGMPELVRDGVDGVIVPHNDPAALAAALDSLHADLEGAAHMGRLGRERLAHDFSPSLHLARLDRIYRGDATNASAEPSTPAEAVG
jgi:glycosyltransferase involved in cell wall biosynthesis